MGIQLTPQQQRALDTQETSLPRIIDPRTNTAYVLVREADYLAELLPTDDLHTAISMILPLSDVGISWTSTDRHPSIAS